MAELEKRVLPRILFLPEELPGSVDLSYGLPPVGFQTGNSCTGWAVGYYCKSFDEHREFGWDMSTSFHQFSPHYLYNQVYVGDDEGAYPSHLYGVLDREGGCTLANFSTNDYRVQPTPYHKECAKPYRICDYGGGYVNINMHVIREKLASGGVLTFSIPWTLDCDNPEPDHHIIYDPVTDRRGRHAICICGYDQNIDDTGVSGFRFVNSHGSYYADSGFAWLSEEFIDRAGDGCRFYWMDDYTTPPAGLRAENNMLLWDRPVWGTDDPITYEIYNADDEVIDSTTDCSHGICKYGPVDEGTYGVGALGSECLETTIVEDCAPTECMFEVI
jgi:hypothetical protein